MPATKKTVRRGGVSGGGDLRPVLITWLATRALMVVVVWQVIVTTGTSVDQVLGNWDVEHYVSIAQHGYRDPLDVAFFPGLPLLMRGLGAVGAPMIVGAAVAAQLASGLAALALHRMFGPLVACLWLLAPMTVFTAVPYTEAFFCAAAFWAWQRGLAGRWPLAAVLAGIACSLRISGLFLIAGLGIMVLVQNDRKFLKRLVAALWLLIPAAVLGAYVVFLYFHTGSWTAWYSAQGAGWQRNLSWPWEALMATLPLTAESYWPGRPEVPVMFRLEIVSVALGYSTAFWCLFKRRWAEFTWVAVNVVALSFSGWFMSVNRAVLLWFPLFVLIGGLLSWQPKGSGARSARRVVLILLLVADLAVIYWWAWIFAVGGWAS